VTTPTAIVVGAGPAGSIAALVLARAGVKVRLLDRALFPRPKLCGDTLNPGSLSILDRLGVGAGVRGRSHSISGMLVTGPGGASVSCDYPDGLSGAAIMRSDLDAFLVDAAVSAGADFTPGVSIRGVIEDAEGRVAGVRHGRTPQERSLLADVVVAADGRRSRLAAARGLSAIAAAPRRWAFGAYFTGVAGLTSRGEMHVRADGYTGVAALSGELANLCVVQEIGSARAAPPRTPAERLSEAVAADPLLRERFARAVRVSPIAALGPLAVDARAAGCPGLLLAGDAAGFVDPMTGDGLRFALRGGELAAEAALRELATGTPAFGSLQAARRREFTPKWRVNRALRLLVGSPSAVRAAAAVSARWGAPVRYLIGVAGDVALARS
jgi:flavin-dependent dehydrogenase